MSPWQCILVADVPAGVKTIQKLLGEQATIVATNALNEALSLMRSGVHLVVSGIHFDESRMLDLLRLAKADPVTRAIPCVCFRDMDSVLSVPLFQSLDIACTALGAAGFVDLYQWRAEYGILQADARFRTMS